MSYYWCIYSHVQCTCISHRIMNDWSYYFVVHHDASIDFQGDFLLNCGGLWLKCPIWHVFFLSFGACSFWHLKRKKSCWEKNVVVYFIFLKESDVVINMLNCLLMCVFWWILRNIWYDNLKNIFFLSVHGESNPQQLCTTGKGNNSCLFHALPNTSMNEWCKLNSISLYAWW